MRAFRKVPILSEKTETPFLPRDYCGALSSLILIHRRWLETRFVVTGLAQWAGTRKGAGVGSGGYRVRFRARPRVIYCRISDSFLKNFGYVWDTFPEIVRTCSDDFRTFSDFFSEMFGSAVGTFWDHLG